MFNEVELVELSVGPVKDSDNGKCLHQTKRVFGRMSSQSAAPMRLSWQSKPLRLTIIMSDGLRPFFR